MVITIDNALAVGVGGEDARLYAGDDPQQRVGHGAARRQRQHPAADAHHLVQARQVRRIADLQQQDGKITAWGSAI